MIIINEKIMVAILYIEILGINLPLQGKNKNEMLREKRSKILLQTHNIISLNKHHL